MLLFVCRSTVSVSTQLKFKFSKKNSKFISLDPRLDFLTVNKFFSVYKHDDTYSGEMKN